MKRLHIHVTVGDLEQSIGFYSTLFGCEPARRESDYAKWMLDEPQLNFAISQRPGVAPGLDHLGMQVDSDADLEAITDRLHAAGARTLQQQATVCCYAKSDKTWVEDPSGLRWESFRSLGEATTYGVSGAQADAGEAAKTGGACCAPAPAGQPDKTVSTESGGCGSGQSGCC